MKIVIKEKNKERINRFLDWLLYTIGYSLVLGIVALMFKSFYIDTSYYYFYIFLSSVIIYILNKTIKPLIVSLTIPLTALTLGLFYPVINLFILKLTDWILGIHFELNNLIIAFLIAILISIINGVMDELIIKPIIRRFNHE